MYYIIRANGRANGREGAYGGTVGSPLNIIKVVVEFVVGDVVVVVVVNSENKVVRVDCSVRDGIGEVNGRGMRGGRRR